MIRNRRTLNINSANRQSGTDEDFNATVAIPMHEKFTHVCVMEANIPKSYYLVQAGDNTFVLVENGVNIVVTVPVGNYNAISWGKQMCVLLTTASLNGYTYMCEFPTGVSGPQTAKYLYTVSNNGISQPSFVFTTNVYEQMGFPMNSTVTFVANTLQSTNVVNFQLEDALYCHSDMVGDGPNSVLQHFYTNGVQDYGIINYKCSDALMMAKKLSGSTTNTFRFSLTDEFGAQISLNGRNWNMVLVAFTEIKPLMLTAGSEPV